MHAAFRHFVFGLTILICMIGVTIDVGPVLIAQDLQKEGAQLTPFVVKSSWLKFGVFDGRILAQDIRRTQSRSLTLYHDQQDAEEHLVVRTVPGQYRLKYALQSPQEILQLDYDIDGVLFIRRENAGMNVQLQQSATGPIRIQIEKDGKTVEYASSRLWLGLLFMQELERVHVMAMLDRLCPETHVLLLFNEAFLGLKRLSLSPVQLEMSKVRTLVALLDDESFAVRQQADRQLRGFGRPLVGVLENVDYSELSVEQRTRLKLIVNKYKVVERDSVASIIATMKWNPRLWQTLARDERNSVLAANSKRRFQQLLGLGEASQGFESLTTSEQILLQLR
ncbi:MAG: hypothetical protein VX776_07555 [Planctomycetota bacterium]|nr:hypothetical protein [Planctomycetota bacterium]